MMYLNHSKLALKKMSKPALVKIGHGILKRLPKTTLVNTVYKLEQLAKSKGIKSIGKIARKAKRKVRSGAKRIKRRVGRKRAKTAYSRFPKRYTNGRTFKNSKKPRRLVKGTPEARKHMAKIRAQR